MSENSGEKTTEDFLIEFQDKRANFRKIFPAAIEKTHEKSVKFFKKSILNSESDFESIKHEIPEDLLESVDQNIPKMDNEKIKQIQDQTVMMAILQCKKNCEISAIIDAIY